MKLCIGSLCKGCVLRLKVTLKIRVLGSLPVLILPPAVSSLFFRLAVGVPAAVIIFRLPFLLLFAIFLRKGAVFL